MFRRSRLTCLHRGSDQFLLPFPLLVDEADATSKISPVASTAPSPPASNVRKFAVSELGERWIVGEPYDELGTMNWS